MTVYDNGTFSPQFWLVVYLRGCVTVDILYGSVNNNFLQNEVKYSTDEKDADCDN